MKELTEAAPVYLNDATYKRLKATLTRLVAEPFDREGTDPETEVVAALGEIGGIWPETVRDSSRAP